MFTGQQNETLCKNYISELKDLRLRIEDCEAGTVARIRKPVEKEPLKECIQKTTEQKVLSSNLNVFCVEMAMRHQMKPNVTKCVIDEKQK